MEMRVIRIIVGVILIGVGAVLFGTTIHEAPFRTLFLKLLGVGLLISGAMMGFYKKGKEEKSFSKALVKQQFIQVLILAGVLIPLSVWIYHFSADYIFVGMLQTAFHGPLILLAFIVATFVWQWVTRNLRKERYFLSVTLALAVGLSTFVYMNAPTYTYEEARVLVEEKYDTRIVETEIKALFDTNSFEYPHYYFRTENSDRPYVVDPETGQVKELR